MLSRRRRAFGTWRSALAWGALAWGALAWGALAWGAVAGRALTRGVRPIDPSATDAIDDAAGHVAAATIDRSAVDWSAINRRAIDRSPIEAGVARRRRIATADDPAAPAVRAVGDEIAIIAWRLDGRLWR